jgi:hypothetical protein
MTVATRAGRPLPCVDPAPTPRLGPSVVALSLVLAGIAVTTSVLGLAADWPYARETADWRLQARAQDLANLVAVVTLVLGTVAAARGSLRGLRVWVGSLLYLGYAFVLYAVTVHFGPLFLPYVAALGLAGHCLWLGFASLPVPAVPEPRHGRAAAAALAVIAVLFALLWLADIVGALARGGMPPALVQAGLPANPVHVLDLALVLPAMLGTALGTRRGRPVDRFLLVPWLVFAALMGIGVIAVLASASPR